MRILWLRKLDHIYADFTFSIMFFSDAVSVVTEPIFINLWNVPGFEVLAVDNAHGVLKAFSCLCKISIITFFLWISLEWIAGTFSC